MTKMTNISSDKIALIGLDWGTSSLRAYLMGCDGALLAERKLPLGIMRLEYSGREQDRRLAFEAALEEACGDWLATAPDAPVIACGMVGSALGWCEAPYLNTPIRLDQLSNHLTPIQTDCGRVVRVVPGLMQKTELVDVMRGEETQLAGCMRAIPQRSLSTTVLAGLPGTHSKWVTLEAGCIQHSATFMTGEVFEALCKHTILGRTMQCGVGDESPSFDFGVETALRQSTQGGVLSTIFTVRSLGLIGTLSAREQPAYLSGLLIGEEVAAVLRIHDGQVDATTSIRTGPLLLVGDRELCGRYKRAFQLMGHEEITIIENASSRGLWEIAIQSGLVAPGFVARETAC
jgi:2-dehydro-3-deoxygalactonokinase